MSDKKMALSVNHFIVDPDFTHENFVVCLNTKNLKSLNISGGEWCLLSGKNSKKMVCSVVRGQCQDSKILMNRMARSSLGLLVGDAVTVERCILPIYGAKTVHLAPTDKTVSPSIIADLLKEYLRKGPWVLFENSKIILRGGNMKVELLIMKVSPMTYGATGEKTEYKLVHTTIEKKTWTSLSNLSYDDIGGQTDAFNELRKFECLLRWPTLYKTLNTAPARILLVGPEGSGKLLMAKAFANETDVHLVCLDDQDFRNESGKENNVNNSTSFIKTKFDEAIENAPSILCINNLQLITPSVLSTSLQKSVAADLIKSVKQLTDPNVIVIGITTVASKIHHSVYSVLIESRNSVEITFPALDFYRRLEILRVCTKNMTFIAGNSILYEIAKISEGYSAAQLSELCEMADNLRTRNACREILDPAATADAEFFIYKRAITNQDFETSVVKMNDRLNL